MTGIARLEKLDIVIIIISIVISVILFSNKIPTERYTYDEADYMYAVSKGFLANYFDHPSLSFLEFLKLGFSKGMDDKERVNLSEFIRKSGDVSFYRHYHGPFYYYHLVLVDYFWGNSEYVMRFATFFWLVCCYLLVYIGCFFLLDTNPRPAALVSATLILFSPSLLSASIQITPHSMFLFVVVFNLLLMAKIIDNRDHERNRTYLFALFVSLSLSFIILENSPFLLLTYLICLIWQREVFVKDTFNNRISSPLLYNLLIFIIVMLICWPGGLFKLTLMKNYLFFAHHALMRADYQGVIGFLEIWEKLLLRSPLELAVILISPLVALYLIIKQKKLLLFPLIFFAVLIILSNTLNKSVIISPKYISASLPALYLAAGIIFSHFFDHSKKSTYIYVALFIIMILCNYYAFFYRTESAYSYSEEICITNKFLAYLNSNNANEKILLLPNYAVPAVNYYHNSYDINSYGNEDANQKIVEIFNNKNCEGLLYAGNDADNILRLMESSGQVSLAVIGADCNHKKIVYLRKIVRK